MGNLHIVQKDGGNVGESILLCDLKGSLAASILPLDFGPGCQKPAHSCLVPFACGCFKQPVEVEPISVTKIGAFLDKQEGAFPISLALCMNQGRFLSRFSSQHLRAYDA